jgi:hypothetical protein
MTYLNNNEKNKKGFDKLFLKIFGKYLHLYRQMPKTITNYKKKE